MNAIYKEARRCYRNETFPQFRVDSTGGSFWVETMDGRGLQSFTSYDAARKAIETESDKASKWIGR
jgi:hypothetical protein